MPIINKAATSTKLSDTATKNLIFFLPILIEDKTKGYITIYPTNINKEKYL
jgi:hypothetical protein